MADFIQVLNYPFVSRALIVGILISLCAALLGVILVLKRYSLIGHGLGDVGFAALSLSLALGSSPLLISTPIIIIAAIFIMAISQNKNIAGDIAIGVVSTGALALGVIITSLAGGFNMDVYNYMFGSILAMDNTDIIFSIVLAIIVIGLFIIFYNRLFIITCDEVFAKACGINVTFYQTLIAILTALTVVIGMRIMGTLLISSLIIFPALIARRLVEGFKALVIAAAVVAVICFIIGIIFSFIFNIPTGACIVAVNIIAIILTWPFSLIKHHAA